jgi:hypothetical protein
MVILVTIVAVVVVGMALLGLWVVHEENRPGPRPVPTVMRRGRRVVRKVQAGDPCPCGGAITETGIVSQQLGAIMGCDGCGRRWAIDGRRVALRRRTPRTAWATRTARRQGAPSDLSTAGDAATPAEP